MDDADSYGPFAGGPSDGDPEGDDEARRDDAEDDLCQLIGFEIYHLYYKQHGALGPTLETCSDAIRVRIVALLERGRALLAEGWDLDRACSAMCAEAGGLVSPFVEEFRREHLGIPPLPSVGSLGTSQRAVVVTFAADDLYPDAESADAAVREAGARRFATAWQQEVASTLPMVDVLVRWHAVGAAPETTDQMVAFLGDWYWVHADQSSLADGVVELGRRIARSPAGWLAGDDGEPPPAPRWWTVTRWGVEYDDTGAPDLRRVRSGRYTNHEEALGHFEQLRGEDHVHTAWGPVQVWLEAADSTDGLAEVASSSIPDGGLTAFGRRVVAAVSGVPDAEQGPDEP